MESDNLQKMQFFQENLNAVFMQKRAFQMELDETLSALSELERSNGEVYKLVGQLMMRSDSEKIKEELKGKEKIINARLEKLEEQEEKFNSELKKIRDDLIKESKKKK